MLDLRIIPERLNGRARHHYNQTILKFIDATVSSNLGFREWNNNAHSVAIEISIIAMIYRSDYDVEGAVSEMQERYLEYILRMIDKISTHNEFYPFYYELTGYEYIEVDVDRFMVSVNCIGDSRILEYHQCTLHNHLLETYRDEDFLSYKYRRSLY